MKKILSALTVVCVSACSTVNYKDQAGIVDIQVEQASVLMQYNANLNDFYQLMSEGLATDALVDFEAMQTKFADQTLVACAQDDACKVSAYEAHFAQLHQYIYKHDLSNVEDIFVESHPGDQHLINVTGFYGFVGENHERLALFIDRMSLSRNEDNNPYGIERVQSIDAILYAKNFSEPAKFIAVGEYPINALVRLHKPMNLESLFYSLDISAIDFTKFSFGISVHLVGHEYEISTSLKLVDVRERTKGKTAPVDKVEPELY